jgi:hypothetical protein
MLSSEQYETYWRQRYESLVVETEREARRIKKSWEAQRAEWIREKMELQETIITLQATLDTIA